MGQSHGGKITATHHTKSEIALKGLVVKKQQSMARERVSIKSEYRIQFCNPRDTFLLQNFIV